MVGMEEECGGGWPVAVEIVVAMLKTVDGMVWILEGGDVTFYFMFSKNIFNRRLKV